MLLQGENAKKIKKSSLLFGSHLLLGKVDEEKLTEGLEKV